MTCTECLYEPELSLCGCVALNCDMPVSGHADVEIAIQFSHPELPSIQFANDPKVLRFLINSLTSYINEKEANHEAQM